MLAQSNDYMKSMVSGLKVLSEDEKVQMACEARDREASLRASMIEQAVKEHKAIIAEQNAKLAEKDSAIAELKAQLEALQNQKN